MSRSSLPLFAACGALALAGCSPAGQETDGPEPVGEAVQADTVAQAADSSCSTLSVKGLSEQIVAQSNCNAPGAFVKLPAAANLDLGATVFPYLEEPAKTALVDALAAKPSSTLGINSMLRTVAQQYLLYRWYLNGQCGIGLAAAPGNSNHETGLAFDTSDYSAWQGTLESHGFKWFGSADTVHFDYVGAGAKDYKGTDILAFQQLWNKNHPDDAISEDGAYGPQTEGKLKAAPADGFAIGAECDGGDAPNVHPSIEIADAPDRFSDASSKGVADLFVGDSYEITMVISNEGKAAAKSVEVTIAIAEPFLVAGDYAIESDWMHAGMFTENEANSEPSNPPHDGKPGKIFTLAMHQLSPGEKKRVRLDVSAAAYSIGVADAPDVRFWVKDVADYYHQDDFGGVVTNKDGSQNFNGGKLEVSLPTDVYSHARWEWDSDRLEGWSPLGSATLTADADAKVLVIDGSGADPGAQGPETELVAADNATVTLRGKREGGSGGAKLYFTTKAEPKMSEDKAIDVDLPDGGEISEIQIRVSDHPKWEGTITGLRFDPFVSGPGTAELDSLSVGDGDGPMPGASSAGAEADAAPPGEAGCACRAGAARGAEARLPAVSFALALLGGLAWRGRRRRQLARDAC